uniref:Retrotransposon gag domain-containing protein n=1 Tax=Moniliophthora roreri TaxID=221103 RepID=A0A0W0FNU9_MONRR
MAVLEAVEKNKEKEKSVKVAPPDFFKEDRKDTKRFLTEVEIFLCMNPKDYDTDKKKCLFLLSYMQGKEPKDPKLEWTEFQDKFKKDFSPANVRGEAQLQIEELKMEDRANIFIYNFQLLVQLMWLVFC